MPMKQTLPVSMFDTHVPEGEHYLNNNNNDNYNTDDSRQCSFWGNCGSAVVAAGHMSENRIGNYKSLTPVGGTGSDTLLQRANPK